MATQFSYKDGFILSMRNAVRLNATAKSAAQEKDFGIACSLNILSIEEAIKGIACLGRHYAPSEVDNIDKFFSNHQIKHKLIEVLLTSIQRSLTTELESYKELSAAMPISDADRFTDEEVLKILYALKGVTPNIPEILKWLEDANNEKNKGFYVNLYKNNTWGYSTNFDELKFQTENTYVESIITYAYNFSKHLEVKYEKKAVISNSKVIETNG